MNEKKELKVAEASSSDVGRGIVRISSHDIKTLGLDIGDIVEIRGKTATSAMVLPVSAECSDRSIIQMDGVIRENAKTQLDSYVEIRKASVRTAEKVVVIPVSKVSLMKINSETNYLNKILNGRSITSGDRVRVSSIGTQVLDFYIESTEPDGIVIIKDKTKITVKNNKNYSFKSSITYEDIGGLNKEIQKIREMIELPLKFPEIFEQLGIESPKGVLLYGPPGTGKTLIAKAVARETDAHFLQISGPEIINKYYGESEAKLRSVFEEAQKNAPSIIFLDEIDAIAPKREDVRGDVEKRVVAQLLALMDGIKSSENVIVIGATNLPDAIDLALRRPGRFDREIYIGIPGPLEREEILKIHMRGMPITDDVDLKQLSEMTNGYVGADLKALCREAAMNALRKVFSNTDLQKGYIPLDVLMAIRVNMQCFVQALKSVEPSALREISIQKPNLSWQDIGGLQSVKDEIRYLIEWPLKYKDLYSYANIKRAKGILLYGPPGCGKTLIARVIASETGYNFISVKGPELLSKWVGESEKSIRSLFKKARQVAPSIIFFDEIDAIIPKRGRNANEVTDRMVSQLLTEIDGLEELRDVIILAATNRIDLIDDALLRSGRFESRIKIANPAAHDRLEIFRLYLGKKVCKGELNIEKYVDLSEGFSGADIETICDMAGKRALEKFILNHGGGIGIDEFGVTDQDIMDAFKCFRSLLREE